jgi:hypothetical protein
MIEITLKGREIPLIYTVCEMKTIQEQVCPLGDLQYKLFGRNKDDENDTSLYAGPEHLGTVAKMVAILGNAGLEENDKDPDLTEKKVLRAMKPGDLVKAMNACVEAMNEGMASEVMTEDKKEEGPVDVVLEEIEKKKEPAG